MKKYNVLGNTEVTICVTVEAENEDEAMERAAKKFKGVRPYCGNGGVDKLIGVEGRNESISADAPVEFDDIMETD